MSQNVRAVDPRNVFLMSNGVLSVADPAKELYACRACLTTDTKLFDIQDCDLAESFENVLGLAVPPNDGFPQHLCPYCFALLQKYGAFRDRCHRSLNVLRRALKFGQLLTTEYISIIDRDAERVSMPLTIYQNEIDYDYVEAPLMDEEQNYENQEHAMEEHGVEQNNREIFKGIKPVKKKKIKKKESKDDELALPVQKLLSRRTNPDVLEDNPFAAPGRSVFRSALASARERSRSRSPHPAREPPKRRRRRQTQRPLAVERAMKIVGVTDGRKLRSELSAHVTGYPGCASALRQGLESRNITVKAMNLLLSSLTASTLRHYNNTYRQWWEYCTRRAVEPCRLSLPDVRDFLAEQIHRGMSFQCVQQMRSGLAFLLGSEVSADSEIKCLMRALRVNEAAHKVKYTGSWDPAIVLNFLSRWYPNEGLTLEKLTKKLVVLLALATEYNSHALSRMKLTDVTIERNGARISARSLKKPVVYLPYYSDPRICPVTCLVAYVRVSESKRPVDCPFVIINVSDNSSRVPASYQTIGRWIHRTLLESGVDMSEIETSNCRSAEIKVPHKQELISLDAIRKQACWTEDAVRFAQFYNVDTTNSAAFVRH